jgi:hypothetical protein
LIGDQQGDLVATLADFSEQFQRLGAGARTQDPVVLAEAATQVAGDGRKNGGLIVDDDDRRAPLGLGGGAGRQGGLLRRAGDYDDRGRSAS